MHRSTASLVKALGWLLVLCVPYVLLGSLYAPRIVQVLNPVICRDDGHLANRATPGSDSVELVCRAGLSRNVTGRIVVLLIALVVAATLCFYLANRLIHPRTRIVIPEAHH